MTEKTKGKSHPFAGHLRPTEEVLWLAIPAKPRSSMLYQLGLFASALAILTGVLAFGVMIDKNVKPNQRLDALILPVGLMLTSAVISLPIVGLFRLLKRNGPPEQAYAITNERLLYRNKKNVSTIALENLPSVSLFLGEGTKGTFSFGAFFPMWPDVEDAIQIKHLIDDAQKKRMQRL